MIWGKKGWESNVIMEWELGVAYHSHAHLYFTVNKFLSIEQLFGTKTL
jgi:hypothetical protein